MTLKDKIQNLPPPKKGWDHTPIAWGIGEGYLGAKSKRVCMERCFACGMENHAFAVASGSCAWCGYNPNEDLAN